MNPPATADEQTLVRRVKQVVVRSLGLALDPDELGEDEVLYGSGLGADSVATLEVVFALEAEFGIEVSDDELRVELFATIRSLVDYVERNLRAR